MTDKGTSGHVISDERLAELNRQGERMADATGEQGRVLQRALDAAFERGRAQGRAEKAPHISKLRSQVGRLKEKLESEREARRSDTEWARNRGQG